MLGNVIRLYNNEVNGNVRVHGRMELDCVELRSDEERGSRSIECRFQKDCC